MTRADWPLLALYAADDGVLTPVQMQKVLFLLDQQARNRLNTDFYTFEAYNYGPFSSRIYNDLDEHARGGIIAYDGTTGRNWSNYVITAQGETHAAAAVSEVDGDVWQYLVRTVAWAKSLRFSELVGAIYRAYPDFARNSIFAPG